MKFFKNLSDVSQVFFWDFAEYYDVVHISFCEIEIFQILVISSWKYAGACANPNGTLTYSHFPNDELKVVLRMEEVSNGIW